jgi:hypothetical protein
VRACAPPWSQHFREHYGPAVKVIVIGRRYECRDIF